MQMRYYITSLWPGLTELWWRGQLAALPAAIAFTIAVNLLLISKYIYPLWVASGLVSMAFWVGLLTWGFFVVRSIREVPALIAPRSVQQEPDRFEEAQAAYLRGKWEDAEALLKSVLAIEPRDPPALLMLGAVYRHTGRLDSAEMLLKEIARLEVADAWWLEVEAETDRLAAAIEIRREASNNPQKNSPESPPRAAEVTETSKKAA